VGNIILKVPPISDLVKSISVALEELYADRREVDGRYFAAFR
jgi:hypothetical protein